MAWHSGKPADTDFLSASVQHIRENFAELEPLHPHVAELVDLTTLHPYIDALLSSRIVEMGSNSNGEYVRFENGLQVCYRFYFELPRFTGSAGETVVGTWTYPAAFVSMPTVFLTNRRSSDDYRGSEFTVSTWYPNETDTMILARNNTGATFSPACGCGAIGRWK